MKASLFHRPISCMVVVGTPERYIAMALPDLNEWHPISSISNPNSDGPIVAAAARSFVLI